MPIPHDEPMDSAPELVVLMYTSKEPEVAVCIFGNRGDGQIYGAINEFLCHRMPGFA